MKCGGLHDLYDLGFGCGQQDSETLWWCAGDYMTHMTWDLGVVGKIHCGGAQGTT